MGRPPTISRHDLLETARRVFAAKGFEKATLSDIGAELKVTAAAILRHFPSKQALFAAAMQPQPLALPPFVAALADVDPAADPRAVLRNLAEQFIPFAQRTLAENLAVYMYSKARTSIVLPFDPRDPDTPPRRGLLIVTDYFRRAGEAGVLRVQDPRAAALLFMGSLQSYVFLHQVLHVQPQYPLDRYIDALIDLWTHGAFGGSHARTKSKSPEDPVATRRDGRRGRGDPPVSPHEAAGERAGVLRNAGGKDRGRRVAVRRPRNKGPR